VVGLLVIWAERACSAAAVTSWFDGMRYSTVLRRIILRSCKRYSHNVSVKSISVKVFNLTAVCLFWETQVGLEDEAGNEEKEGHTLSVHMIAPLNIRPSVMLILSWRLIRAFKYDMASSALMSSGLDIAATTFVANA
jgi:hypothetical protein